MKYGLIIYFSLLLISVTWLSFILSAPMIVSGDNFPGQVYYTLFSNVCHQMPERSFFINSIQLPVCVRCFAIYVGIFFMLLVYPLLRPINSKSIPRLKYLVIFLVPIVIDGVAQFFQLYPSPSWLRFSTGFIAGGVVIFFTLPIINLVEIEITKPSKPIYSREDTQE